MTIKVPARLRPLVALVAVAVAGGALGGYFGLRAASSGAGSAAKAGPSARTGAAMAYDAATETIVLFGGESDDGALRDTWTWDGSTWTRQHPATSPPPRAGALMAYDPANRDVILVGGANYPSTGVGFSGCAVPGTVVPLPAPISPGAAVPPSPCPKATPQPGIGPLQDTWRWDGGNWHRAGEAPATVSGGMAQLVTEPVRGTVLLLTASYVRPELGRACPLLTPGDTAVACPPIAVQPAYAAYTLGASGWAHITAPATPATGGLGLANAALVVDPTRGRVSLFQEQPPSISVCGQIPTVPEPVTPQSTAAAETVPGKAGGVAPGALPCRQPDGAAVKPVQCCAGREVVWTGSKWDAAGQFAGGPSLAPSASLVGDEATRSVVYLDDQAAVTWVWTGKWTKLRPARHPTVTGAASAYDAKRGQVVLFGGWFAGGGVFRPAAGVSSRSSWSDQTWTWDGTNWTQQTGGAAVPNPPFTPAPQPPTLISPPSSPGCPVREPGGSTFPATPAPTCVEPAAAG